MKKALIAILTIFTLLACVFGGVLAGASLGGGIPAGSFLARVPGMRRLAGVQKPEEDAGQEGDNGEETPRDAEEQVEIPYGNLAPEERLKRMVRRLEERIKEVNNREERLSRREKELEGWEKAVKEQRKKISELARRKKKELMKVRKQIQQKRKKLQRQKIEMSKQRKENLQKAAKIYNRMDEAQAAATLARLYRQGKEDTVVQVIYLMKDRKAAGVLAAMPEDGVGAEITRRLAHVSQESE